MVSDCNVSKRPLKVLLCGEESQEVCKAFRALGHEAYSCDLKPCSGGRPEWHFQMDMKEAIHLMKWDIVIFFPECKHLCWSGERWFSSGKKDIQLRLDAFEFFKWCYHYAYEKLGIEMIAVENSLSLFLERNGYPPTQKVHPFHFGSPYRKTTCLWVRGLKPLIPTDITFRREPAVHNMWPKKGVDRSALRARTDPNVARAMAEQWGGHIGCCCQNPFGEVKGISQCCPIHNEREYDCQCQENGFYN